MTAMRTSIASHAVTVQTCSQSGHAAGTLNPSHSACCAAGPFFSSVAVSGWGVVVDYRPRRVDLGALRSGALTEVRLDEMSRLLISKIKCWLFSFAELRIWDTVRGVVRDCACP